MKVRSTYIPVLLSTFCTIGCQKSTETINTEITKNEPVAAFRWSGEQVAPAMVNFNDLSSNTKGVEWDFGNGTHSIEKSPTILYSVPGFYQVFLKAYAGEACSLIKKGILIGRDKQPLAHFSYTFKDSRSFLPVTLKIENNSINATSYEWDIDGVIYYAKSPDFVMLNTAGEHVITLTAINGAHRSEGFRQVIHVSSDDAPISAFVIPYHPSPYQVGEQIQVFNTSLNSDSWSWDFGAGIPSSSTEENPVVRFDRPGIHRITLIARKGTKLAQPFSFEIRI